MHQLADLLLSCKAVGRTSMSTLFCGCMLPWTLLSQLLRRQPPAARLLGTQHVYQSTRMLPLVSSGACLTLGPAQVLSGGQELQLPATVNIGLNAQGLHIMDSMQYRWEKLCCCWDF